MNNIMNEFKIDDEVLEQVELRDRFLAGLINWALCITIVAPILNLYFMLMKNWSIGSKIMGYTFEVEDNQKLLYILLSSATVAFFFPVILIVNTVLWFLGSRLLTEKLSYVKLFYEEKSTYSWY